jgi:hypothetical protein
MDDPVVVAAITDEQAAAIDNTYPTGGGLKLGTLLKNVVDAVNLIVEALGNLEGEGYPT